MVAAIAHGDMLGQVARCLGTSRVAYPMSALVLEAVGEALGRGIAPALSLCGIDPRMRQVNGGRAWRLTESSYDAIRAVGQRRSGPEDTFESRPQAGIKPAADTQ